MSDTNLLIVGIVVFGLMLIGMALTVVEFRRLSKVDAKRRKLERQDNVSERPRPEDRD
ncbi:MAG: hypothetical protein HKP21_08615 [Xanthomonadales bacterium]|nr:hypothetical protein [Gammaproteobacteria bacterium]MBT8076737.1 hypothetical protein [Gammaproteobacteria bacterium]NNK04602.1 hypothetical protein [Xanthomonadales bacterium]